MNPRSDQLSSSLDFTGTIGWTPGGPHRPGQGPATTTQEQAMVDIGQDKDRPPLHRNRPWSTLTRITRTGHHYTGTGHGQHWPGQGPATTTQEQAMVATVPRITRTGHHYTGTGHGRHWPGQGPATTTQKQAMADTGQDNKDMPPLHINGDANSFCGCTGQRPDVGSTTTSSLHNNAAPLKARATIRHLGQKGHQHCPTLQPGLSTT